MEEKEKVTKPLNQALKAERARWKPLEDMYTEAIEALRTTMTIYQTELVRVQKEEQAKIAARVGEGRGHLKVETAVKKLSEVATPEKEVSTNAGLVQFREVKVLKIVDLDMISREYFDLNESRLLTDLKAGIVVPGAEIETKQVPANYR